MPLSKDKLYHARDLGAITYASAYINLMAIHHGIDNSDQKAMNEMAVRIVPAINFGTQAAWCGLMGDQDGRNIALEQLRSATEALSKSKGKMKGGE
jgi:hypothetical protein